MKLCDAIANAKNINERTVGGILTVIAGCSEEAREIIEQDLDNKEMSLGACFRAIEDYARKHKTGNCFACAVFGVEPENEIVRVICDFYKIPEGWNATPHPSPAATPSPRGEGKKRARVDLMELL